MYMLGPLNARCRRHGRKGSTENDLQEEAEWLCVVQENWICVDAYVALEAMEEC